MICHSRNVTRRFSFLAHCLANEADERRVIPSQHTGKKGYPMVCRVFFWLQQTLFRFNALPLNLQIGIGFGNHVCVRHSALSQQALSQ